MKLICANCFNVGTPKTMKHARVGFASWVLDDDDKLALVTCNVSFRKAS
jgi:hypothetical protein